MKCDGCGKEIPRDDLPEGWKQAEQAVPKSKPWQIAVCPKCQRRPPDKLFRPPRL
jgi:hypothetical protein